jgi:LPXTG-site transpeptidase (sortase) family protein
LFSRKPETVLNFSVKPSRSRLTLFMLCIGVTMLVASALMVTRHQSQQPRKNLAGRQVRGTALVSVSPQTSSTSSTTTLASPAARPAASPGPTTTIPAIGIPVRISIPSIAVNALVVSVGLKTDGSMEIPGASEAGWYHFGSRPGDQVGSAVIAAHVDHNGEPGVFINLTELSIGAQVTVIDRSGNIQHFEVTERYQVAKQELPGTELFRTVGAPTLTLITCGGTFDKKTRRYGDNIVVRATPVLL